MVYATYLIDPFLTETFLTCLQDYNITSNETTSENVTDWYTTTEMPTIMTTEAYFYEPGCHNLNISGGCYTCQSDLDVIFMNISEGTYHHGLGVLIVYITKISLAWSSCWFYGWVCSLLKHTYIYIYSYNILLCVFQTCMRIVFHWIWIFH